MDPIPGALQQQLVHGLPTVGAAWPMLLVSSARPELLQRCATWGEDQPAHRLLQLRALDAAQGEALAQALLSRVSDGADALRALLVERADGNPFYMEELVRMFIDDGVIAVEGEQWRVLPERLSFGQRQRVAVARALVHRPDFLLADEPTASLDPDNARRVMEALLELTAAEGSALLLVSHDLDLLDDFALPRARMAGAPEGRTHRAWLVQGEASRAA